MTDTMTAPASVVPRLKVKYTTEIRDALSLHVVPGLPSAWSAISISTMTRVR